MSKEEVLTPTWAATYHLHVMAIGNSGTPYKTKIGAWKELDRMAEAADKWNEHVKELQNVDTWGADI